MCQCASVLSHLKVLRFRFTYERCPNHCLKNLSNFIVFLHIYTPSDSNFQSKPNCYIFGAGVPMCQAVQTKWFWNHCLINLSNLIQFSHIYTPLESDFNPNPMVLFTLWLDDVWICYFKNNDDCYHHYHLLKTKVMHHESSLSDAIDFALYISYIHTLRAYILRKCFLIEELV